MGWQLSPDRYNSNCQEESWCLLHQKRDLYGVFYTVSYHIIYMVIVVTGKNSLGMKPQCLCKRRRGVTRIAYVGGNCQIGNSQRPGKWQI